MLIVILKYRERFACLNNYIFDFGKISSTHQPILKRFYTYLSLNQTDFSNNVSLESPV